MVATPHFKRGVEGCLKNFVTSIWGGSHVLSQWCILSAWKNIGGRKCDIRYKMSAPVSRTIDKRARGAIGHSL